VVDPHVVAFSLTSAFILVSALGTVASKRLFQSALFLAATLVGVAVLFLLLGAEFLFIVQILVYVGAIVTLILFAIMFTQGSALEEET
jgi:NADH:ubiquinone oxidoreductase subunit 6 (subunit J)